MVAEFDVDSAIGKIAWGTVGYAIVQNDCSKRDLTWLVDGMKIILESLLAIVLILSEYDI